MTKSQADTFTILFVCTGNTCRSPMAEAALKSLLGKEQLSINVKVISAGVAAATGYPATMYAAEAVKLWDGDLSYHRSQPLTKPLVENADLIFGMTSEHVREVLRLFPGAKDKTYLLKGFPDHSLKAEGVDDPIGQSLDRYNETFLEIGEFLGKNLREIVERIDAKGRNA